jgi:hypothetical protein
LNAGGIRQHAEDLDYQIHLVCRESATATTLICVHMQIVAHARLGPLPRVTSRAVATPTDAVTESLSSLGTPRLRREDMVMGRTSFTGGP